MHNLTISQFVRHLLVGPESGCGRESRPHGKLQMAIGFLINNEPVHEISNNAVCATSKTSDQPVHTHSLIRAFASRLNIL